MREALRPPCSLPNLALVPRAKQKPRLLNCSWVIPGGTLVKNPPASAGDVRDAGSIPGSGRSPGEGNGNPLQYLCLENPTDRRAWWATVYGVTKSLVTTESARTTRRTRPTFHEPWHWTEFLIKETADIRTERQTQVWKKAQKASLGS